MLEFLNAVGEGLPGRLNVALFLGGLTMMISSGCVFAATDEEIGEGGILFGFLMSALSVFLLLVWVFLRVAYWVVTGV